MNNLKRKTNQRFIILTTIFFIVFLSFFYILKKHVLVQHNDAYLINKSGKQRMLSQRLSKLTFIAHNDKNLLPRHVISDSIYQLSEELKTSHFFLFNEYIKTDHSAKLDSLFSIVDSNLKLLIKESKDLINATVYNRSNMAKFRATELAYLFAMDAIVNEYQKRAESNLKQIEYNFYKISGLCVIIMITGFFFLWFPNIRLLLAKNKDLEISNTRLKKTQSLVDKNLEELDQLRFDLEQKEYYNQIFISQAAPSLAMLDKDMKYIAVSEKWKKTYNKENVEIIGKSHYDIFPEIGDDWKANHQKCLNGYIDVCEEAPFVRADGTVQWIFWDVRPWYLSDGKVGGLLMYTGDITKQKEERLAKEKVEQILKSTSEVAKIGTWELDVKSDKLTFSPMAKKFLKIKSDKQLYGNRSLFLYKDGASRKKIIKAIQTIKNTGKPFDLELEVITSDREHIWVRDIGKAEFVDGECVRVFGVVQDITYLKQAESKLLKQNELLNFAEKINNIGHWILDTKSDKITWSSSMYDVSGIDKDVKIDKNTLLEMTHPDDVDLLINHMKQTMTNKCFDGELVHRIVVSDGSVKTVSVLGKVIKDSNDEICEIIGTCQDITKQRMAEIKFKGLLESAPDAMIILNANKRIHLINKQAEKMFGYTYAELLDKKIEILIPKRIVGNFKTYKDNYFEDPKSIGMGENKELIGVNKKGEEFTVQVSLSPVETEDGLLVSAAIRDVTKQKEDKQKIISANKNLEHLADKLIAQNMQLADFAQITSHNLRAPVSNLNSLLDMYDLSVDQLEKEEVIYNFKKVTSHLTLTLNTLVQALKVKNDRVSQSNVFFDETLYKTKELLAAQIIKTKANITFDFSEINKISYNKIYFESIFLNLVENALKYRSQTRTPEIHVWTTKVDGKAVLHIQDNGLGIDLNRHRHKLFGLHKVFHRHPEAKGVGLFMTKLHVEALGGKITAESVVNEGSTFIINFNK